MAPFGLPISTTVPHSPALCPLPVFPPVSTQPIHRRASVEARLAGAASDTSRGAGGQAGWGTRSLEGGSSTGRSPGHWSVEKHSLRASRRRGLGGMNTVWMHRSPSRAGWGGADSSAVRRGRPRSVPGLGRPWKAPEQVGRPPLRQKHGWWLPPFLTKFKPSKKRAVCSGHRLPPVSCPEQP